MSQQGHRIYRLGEVDIDTARLCLKRSGIEQRIRRKSFQVLLYLLQERERVVTKDELIEHFWPGTAVTDNALEQCLAEIRRAMGDDSRQPRFIKTVPRAGYRFIGNVQEIDRSQADVEGTSQTPVAQPAQTDKRRWITPRPWLIATLVLIGALGIGSIYFVAVRPRKDSLARVTLPQDPNKQTVAVMFFDNESGGADIDWLREGLADMIITDLSRSKNLTVLSRQQLHVLLERIGNRATNKIGLEDALNIAQKSQARIVILGSFAKLGEQIRIDVHLHDARDGQLLTAERLVVDQPAQILTQVDVLSLKVRTYLTGAEQAGDKTVLSSSMTSNLEAYRYYSLGVERAQAVRNGEALAFLQKAVALDPDFAMAHARIGYVYGVAGNSTDKAKPYLEKAFQLTNRLTDKDKLQITAWYAIVNFDYGAAIDAFRRVIAVDPQEMEAYRRLGLLLKGEEQFGEALEVLKQGLVMDPGAKDLYNTLGSVYSEMGRHDDAIAMSQRYVQLGPQEPNAHDSLGMSYEWAGRYFDAVDEYQQALALKPDFEVAIIHLGNTYFQQGRYREAIEQYQRYIRFAPSELEPPRGYDSIAYVERSRGNLSAAERATKSAIKYDQKAVGQTIMIALEKKDLATALKLRETLETSFSSDRGYRGSQRYLIYFRGLFDLKEGRQAEAIQNFKQALSHRPPIYSIDAYEDCLANAFLALGDCANAIAEYQRILKLNPNYPLVHYHLAQAYERNSQPEQARAEYERFLEVWKDADADIPEVMAAKKALGR